MEDIFVFLTVLISLIFITVWIYCATITAKIGAKKGYNDVMWFIVGLVTVVFGITAAVVMPSKYE